MNRHLETRLEQHFINNKQILSLLGARQVGKTTLLRKIFPNAVYFLLDNKPIWKIFSTYDINSYRQLLKIPSTEKSVDMTVILDEIHLLEDPGQAAKIIYDQIPGIKIIITGSSAFNIKNRTAESLAGRKISYYLYPLTFNEYLHQMGVVSELKDGIFPTITEENKRNQVYPFDLKAILTYVMTYGL